MASPDAVTEPDATNGLADRCTDPVKSASDHFCEERDDQFRILFEKYYRRVARMFLHTMHFDSEGADELAQETFVRLYETFGQYRGVAEWAFVETVARRVALNKIRSGQASKRKAAVIDIDEGDFDVAAPSDPDYAERQEAERRQARLAAAIEALPEGARQAMLLYLNDFTYEQIATTLHVSVDSVRSRLRDAKKILRTQLGSR